MSKERRHKLKVALAIGAAMVLAPSLLLLVLTAIDSARLEVPKAGQVFQTAYMQRSATTKSSEAPTAVWMPLDEISGALSCAALKAEDHLFFRHNGFSWDQLLKAARLAISGDGGMGGSTISQQLARNLFLSPDRSLWRKLREAALTVVIEARLSKTEIFAYYLNSIEWGDGVWGASAAARHYFGKEAAAIDVEEALFLASLIANPRGEPTGTQLMRMDKVYHRVNHQLMMSGLTKISRWREALRSWSDWVAALQSGAPLNQAVASFTGKPPAGIPTNAIGAECGLAKEIANTTYASAVAAPSVLALDPKRRAIETTLLTPDTFPVHLSPDGSKLLLKAFERDRFTLLMRDAVTGAELYRDTSSETQLAPTWRPDASSVAFTEYLPASHAYGLFLAELDVFGRTALPAPVSKSAPPIIWSPDGKRLAYARVDPVSGVRELRALELIGGVKELPVAAPMAYTGGFDWSPEGDQLATVDARRPGMVTTWSLTGERIGAFVVSDGSCRSVHWRNNGAEILVACRGAADEFYALSSVTVSSGVVTRRIVADGDVSGPILLPAGRGLAFHVTRHAETRPWIADGKSTRSLGTFDGSALISSVSTRGDFAYVVHTGRLSPPRLVEVSLATALPVRDVFSSGIPAASETRATDVWLESTDGVAIPAFHWLSSRPVSERTGIVMVHGGPESFSSPVWGSTKLLLLDRGVDVLAVNYRGSTGFGRHLEAFYDEAARVTDVLSAVTYLERERGIPRSRIMLWGHSYGARLVADALQSSPDAVGSAIILSLSGSPRSTSTQPFPGKLLVYHGIDDHAQSPASARQALRSLLPPPPRLLWRDIEGEGHSFHRNSTWSDIYASVFETLGLD